MFTFSSPDLETLVDRVHHWNEHKKKFTQHEIEVAYQRLTEQGWVSA
jgi:hypothetical protein